jgi:uncharacterized membrane protein
MISALAYFVMILGVATSALSVADPWIRRLQLYYQFHQLGMDDAIEKIARIQDQAAYPFEVFGFLVGIATVVIAIGLIRRRGWARLAWMWGSGFLLVEFITFAVYSRDSSLSVILVIVFRLVVFAISLSILGSKRVRDQFSRGNQETATAV